MPAEKIDGINHNTSLFSLQKQKQPIQRTDSQCSIWKAMGCGMLAHLGVKGIGETTEYFYDKYFDHAISTTPKEDKIMLDGVKKAIKNTGLTNIKISDMLPVNAAFDNNKNILMLPKSGMFTLSSFHELGHAHNFNKSKFWNCMQRFRFRGLCYETLLLHAAMGIIGLTALLKKPKQEGEVADGVFDKATDMIKHNAGKLTFALYVPQLAEEGMASIKGAKFAKNILTQGLLSKMKKMHKLAFVSYLLEPVFAGLAISTMVKVKDKMLSKNNN